MYADREEFIKKFKEEHPHYIINDNNSISRTTKTHKFKKRYDYLYQLDKEKRRKIEQQKNIKIKEQKEKELDECTFTPKITSSSYLKRNYSQNNLNLKQIKNFHTNENENMKNTQTINDSMITRQQYWMNKRNNKLDNIMKLEEKKMLNECIFSPIIRSDNEIKWEIFQGKAENLVADPESYEQYIKRVTDKREKDKKERQNEANKPGNGNIWKNKHLLPKSYSKKTFKTIHNEKTSIRNKSTGKNRKILNIGAKPSNDEFIDYESAIKCLHQELNSIKLME